MRREKVSLEKKDPHEQLQHLQQEQLYEPRTAYSQQPRQDAAPQTTAAIVVLLQQRP